MSRPNLQSPITNPQLPTIAPGASAGVTKIRVGCPAHNCLLVAHAKTPPFGGVNFSIFSSL